MEGDKRLETLQQEIKLLKGELKQSLASVRDYLLNMELPSTEFSSILAALGADGEQKMTLKGDLKMPEQKPPEEPQDELTEIEELEDEEGKDEEPEEAAGEEEQAGATPEDELTLPEPEDSEAGPMEPEMEEPPMDEDKTAVESQGIPRVNMLANLLNWVAAAKRDIGREHIPIFLEVYGLSGHLSPELKEIIIQLADMTVDQKDTTSYAAVWSQAMLALHGILSGGDAPRHPWTHSLIQTEKDRKDEEDIIEVDKSQPVKLKLVLPDDAGKEREFSLDLTPNSENNITRSALDTGAKAGKVAQDGQGKKERVYRHRGTRS